MKESAYKEAAKLIGCEVAVIKAVAKVESPGSGFLNGKPRILFEPHIFWRELEARGIDPAPLARKNRGILYRTWQPGAYGTYAEQHDRLNRAMLINRGAALSSASWGAFQIMGFNWKKCGCASLQDFINAIYKSEEEHLRLFVQFIINRGLADELRDKRWAAFAEQYNGPGYKANRYDTKLEAAYKSFL